MPLSRSRLQILLDLTQALGEAIVQGDLDRAENLLLQRRQALEHLDWSGAGNWGGELAELRRLEEKLQDLCCTWQEALRERLRALEDHRLLRHSYRPCHQQARFVDMRE